MAGCDRDLLSGVMKMESVQERMERLGTRQKIATFMAKKSSRMSLKENMLRFVRKNLLQNAIAGD